MIERFLQNKLAHWLDQFIEFENLKLMTKEGVTIKNSKIKQKFVEILSQFIGMPLKLQEGSIQQFILNKPWSKLFLLSSESMKVTIDGITLKTKLKTQLSETYVQSLRQRELQRLTQSLLNPLSHESNNQSQSYIMKKLRQYFLGSIILEIKNVRIQIEIQIRRKTVVVLAFQQLVLRSDKNGKFKVLGLNVKNLSMRYQTEFEKEVQLMSPSNLQFKRQKTAVISENSKSESNKQLSIDRIKLNLTNFNYKDIQKSLQLIKWHNSFIDLPNNLWAIKPYILKQKNLKKRFYYYVKLIVTNIRDKNVKKVMDERREYVKLYQRVLGGFASAEEKKRIEKIESEIFMWKIVAYRDFCIRRMKMRRAVKKEQAVDKNVPMRDNEKNKGEVIIKTNWWSNSWFKYEKNSQELEDEFFKKLNKIQTVPLDIHSTFTINVEQIIIKVSIVTEVTTFPFISISIYDLQYDQDKSILEKSWHKKLTFMKFKVDYQKYLGHFQKYKRMVVESKAVHGEEMDEFDDIQYFLEVQMGHHMDFVKVRIEPFDLYVNQEVIENFQVFLKKEKRLTNFSQIQNKILNRYQSKAILQQIRKRKIQEKLSSSAKIKKQSIKSNESIETLINKKQENQVNKDIAKKQTKIKINTGINIILPLSMRDNVNNQIIIKVKEVNFQKNGIIKKINCNGIQVRGIFMKTIQKEEEESINSIITYFNPFFEEFSLVSAFNFEFVFENHQNFDHFRVNLSKVKLKAIPQNVLFKLIHQIYAFIPKPRQQRQRPQFRRKQSIGQQFMDACQNLNEQIAKSMISVSEKNSVRNSILQNKTVEGKIYFGGFQLQHQNLILSMSQVQLSYFKGNYVSLKSFNEKMVKIKISNIKQLLTKMKQIYEEIKKEKIKKGLGSTDSKIQKQSEFQIENVIIQVEIIIKKKFYRNQPLSIKLLLKDSKFLKFSDTNRSKIMTKCCMSYDEEDEKNGQLRKVHFVEPMKISLEQQEKYNLMQTHLKLSELHVNIKPNLFKVMSETLNSYKLQERQSKIIKNLTFNAIRLKNTKKNFYESYKYKEQFQTSDQYAQAIIFGNKISMDLKQDSVDLNESRQSKSYKICQNIYLIQKQIEPFKYTLESNLKIINHQQKTLWLKISENYSKRQEAKRDEFSFKKAKDKTFSPDQFLEKTDLLQRVNFSSSRDLEISDNIIFNKPENYEIEKKKSENKQNINMPLKPNEPYQFLINSYEEKVIQIYDQGIKFGEIPFQYLLQEEELVVRTEDSFEEQEYLIIKTEKHKEESQDYLTYTFHIYSPIFIKNSLPWTLQYRFQKDEFGRSENSELKRPAFQKKRSFQNVPYNSLKTLQYQKLRTNHYDQISNLRISARNYERDLNFNALIQNNLKLNLNKNEFKSFSQLITLSNGKKQIQVILRTTLSENIIKIYLYPQFAIINFTKMEIKFKVQQNVPTYPTIKVKPLELDKKINQSKENKKRRHQRLLFLKEYINLADQNFQKQETVKHLFTDYIDYVQLFTGTLDEKIVKKMIFEKGVKDRVLTNNSVNDLLTESEGDDIVVKQDETELQRQEFLLYGKDQIFIFKRVINISKHFNLILFVPTLQIINKSESIFYAKSSCEKLIKISKQSTNHLMITKQGFDIQAREEEQEVCLNEWLKLRIDKLGTIYYAKDMAANGYESREYALRKKRMKKTPKIFYRIVLSKFQGGFKLLIEESQYPPLTFINSTRSKLKIEEISEHIFQELPPHNGMGEYSPKDPYHKPQFKIHVAIDYDYKLLKQFDISQKIQIPTNFNNIHILIQQFKDKIIVIFKDSKQNQISNDFKNQLLLQQLKKFVVSVGRVDVSVMNEINREMSGLVIQKVILGIENKNQKDYYNFQIKDLNVFDYTSIQPNFIFHRKPAKKFVLPLIEQVQEKENFFSLNLVMNRHKNTLIIEKCVCEMVDLVFHVSGHLILLYIKNYYSEAFSLISLINYYFKGGKQKNKKEVVGEKTFIIELFDWKNSSLTFKINNLSIIQLFVNQTLKKLLIRFINWLQQLKPINFNSMKIEYQQLSLRKIINLALSNPKKKAFEIINIFMEYPINLFSEVLQIFVEDQGISLRDKIQIFFKISKMFKYVIEFFIESNENISSKLKNYDQIFQEKNRDIQQPIPKMKKYKYSMWNYQQPYNRYRITKNILRLQRYNHKDQIKYYDDCYAKVKLAMDSYLGNKIARKIEKIFLVNQNYLLGVVQGWFIIFWGNYQWIVVSVQHLIKIQKDFQKLTINYLETDGEKLFKGYKNEEQKKYSTKLKELVLDDSDKLEYRDVEWIREYVKENSLSCYY